MAALGRFLDWVAWSFGGSAVRCAAREGFLGMNRKFAFFTSLFLTILVSSLSAQEDASLYDEYLCFWGEGQLFSFIDDFISKSWKLDGESAHVLFHARMRREIVHKVAPTR